MALGFEQIVGYISTGKDALAIIEMLLKQESSIIRAVADAHRKSAEQAIRAAKMGNYEQHTRVALGHLRDVYNLLCSEGTKKPSFWNQLNEGFGGTSTRTAVGQRIYKEAAEIAALISRKHRDLGEWNNAQDWKEHAMSSFDKYAEFSLSNRCSSTYSGSPISGGQGWQPGEDRETVEKQLEQERTVLEGIC